MVLNRGNSSIEHGHFFELASYLGAGDVLVFNDSRVMPARLNGRKVNSGGRLEVLLLRRLESGIWEALVKPAKRVKSGTRIEITAGGEMPGQSKAVVLARIVEVRGEGIVLISFDDEGRLPELGHL